MSKSTELPAPLPVRDGVAPSYLWLPEGSWPDMLAFFTDYYPHIAPLTWLSRMEKGEVRDAAGARILPTTPFKRGLRIFYYRELEAETPIPFAESILHQDQHILVADKPHFLPVTPSGRFLHETLLVRLKKSTGIEALQPIHRLDRETAGVVIFSTNPATRGIYQSLFQQRAMEKRYHAIAPVVEGHVFPFTYRSRIEQGEPFFRMQEVAGEPNSETLVDVLEQRAGLALYELRPHTGKQHQLRIHMAALGAPIVNDDFYPDALPCKADDMSRPLQLLAKEIGFVDPLSGERRQFASAQSLTLP